MSQTTRPDRSIVVAAEGDRMRTSDRKSVLVWRLLCAAAALTALSSGVRVGAQQKVRLNPLIARLEKGEIALTGRDWAFIDMEHGPYLLDRLQTTLGEMGAKK